MLRILIAHSDQKLSQIYGRYLKEHFLVDSVFDGLAAIRRVKMSPPAIIVSEYHLPILSGVALLRFVRSHPDSFAIPFLFLSNHHDNTQALSLGANDWLNLNQCHPTTLLDRIFHHLKANKYGLQIHRA